MKEIYNKKQLTKLTLKTVNKLADTVLLTMGPNGRTVTLYNDQLEPYITKDGVSVANSISFRHPVKDAVATLIKEVAQRTVEQAGDGTTTSICLAQSFINKGYELLKSGVSYNEIKEELDKLEGSVLQQLEKSAKECTSEDIINVATISANNDSEIGKLISNAYKHSNIVKVEESDNDTDSLINVNGIKIDSPYFTKAFINNPKKGAIEYKNCKLVVFDGKVNTIKDIEPVLIGNQELPIVIIADHFSETVVSILKSNYSNGNLEIGLIKSPSFAESRRNIMKDIINYTLINRFGDTDLYSGNIDSIFSNKDETIISKKEIDIETYINDLKEELANEANKSSKKLIQSRIDTLEGNLSIIRVGGNSELEMRERKDRIDDAVLAVKSATEEGIIEGGGVALFKIWEYFHYNTKLELFRDCLMDPYNIIENTTNKALLLNPDSKIVDPHKVTRCALQNAISISKTILGTEALVLDSRLWI